MGKGGGNRAGSEDCMKDEEWKKHIKSWQWKNPTRSQFKNNRQEPKNKKKLLIVERRQFRAESQEKRTPAQKRNYRDPLTLKGI